MNYHKIFFKEFIFWIMGVFPAGICLLECPILVFIFPNHAMYRENINWQMKFNKLIIYAIRPINYSLCIFWPQVTSGPIYALTVNINCQLGVKSITFHTFPYCNNLNSGALFCIIHDAIYILFWVLVLVLGYSRRLRRQHLWIYNTLPRDHFRI